MPEFDENVLRETIRILRDRKGLSQLELAEAVFVGRNTITNYESGRTIPEIGVLVRICKILECDLETIVFGIEHAAIKENQLNIKIKTMSDQLFIHEKEKVLTKEFLNTLDKKNEELNTELEKAKSEIEALKSKIRVKK